MAYIYIYTIVRSRYTILVIDSSEIGLTRDTFAERTTLYSGFEI